MPILGAHTSIAGGLYKAFERMTSIGGEAIQIFTRNQRQWSVAKLSEEEIRIFHKKFLECGRPFIASHASYLINLVTCKKELAERSIMALSAELERCSALEISWVVVHPGSYRGEHLDTGLKMVAQNLDQVFKKVSYVTQVGILLETVAGQGFSIGRRFEELAKIINYSSFKDRLGVCIDTCHIFAAGYDIRNKISYQRTFDELIKVVGLERIKLFHLNDSKGKLGSRIDRHEHIGKGQIGLHGFSLLLNDPRFKNHPMILETPKEKGLQKDIENLSILRSLI